jgi:hypothetical protein
MANAPIITKDKNPIRVYSDTVTAAVEIFPASQSIAISAIKFVGFTTAGHKAELTDASGHTVWKDAVDAPGTNGTPSTYNSFDPPLFARGLSVCDLDSGELFIYKATNERS